ncbi:hypothetical protein ACE4RR_09025 [Alteribacillus sp. HJP-4]
MKEPEVRYGKACWSISSKGMQLIQQPIAEFAVLTGKEEHRKMAEAVLNE